MSGEEAPPPPAMQLQEKTPDDPPPPAAAAASSSSSAAASSSSSPGPSSPGAGDQPFSCRAVVLTGYGGYDKVRLQVRTQKPQLKPGEVLLRIRACGLNFAELMGKQGLYEPLPPPPVIMGMEAAGVIEEVGEEVEDRKVGDRVIAMGRSGMWQEVVAVPAERTYLMPEQMSFEEGAALPINYITAYMMLFNMANLRPGKSVLVHMAAGGVGIAATQLCQTVQDVTVFGTASASKHETIAQGGVTHPIDYRMKDFVEEIHQISPEGVDIVLDPLGGSDTQKGFNLLKPMGSLIVFGAANLVTGQRKSLLAMMKTWYQQLSLSALKLMQTNKAIGGFHLGFITDEELIRNTMHKLLELYRQGRIKPRIDSCFHFEEVADAMRRMHERQNIGKVVLLPEPKKKQEQKPQSDTEPGESVEKSDRKEEKKKEEEEEEKKEEKKKEEEEGTTEEVKAEKD